MTYPRVLVRGEQGNGRVGIVESVMPAGAAGPFLHRHDFDEAFNVLAGELTFLLDGDLMTVGAGGSAFAPAACRTPSPTAARRTRTTSWSSPGRLRARVRAPGGAQGGRRAAGVGAAGDPGGDAPRAADRRGVMRGCAGRRCPRIDRHARSREHPGMVADVFLG
jgi:hypothetical protein